MKKQQDRHSKPAASQPHENNNSTGSTSRRESREPGSGIFHSLAQRLRSDRSPTSPKAAVFQRVHHPDRPAVPVLPTDIPSEDECRFFLEHYLNSPTEEAARSPSFGSFIKQEVSQRRAAREEAEMENQRQMHRRPLPTSRGTVAGPSSRRTSGSVSSNVAAAAAAASTSTFASAPRPVQLQDSSLYPGTTAQGAPRTLHRVPPMASGSVGQVTARSAAPSPARPRPGQSAHGSVANDPHRQLHLSGHGHGQYASPMPAPKPPVLMSFSDRMAALEASQKKEPAEPRPSSRHETERRPQYGSYQRPTVAWSHHAAPLSFQRLSEQADSPPPTAGPVRPAQPSRPDQTPVRSRGHGSAAVTAAIAAAEAQSGEQLLEWDIEVIKASMESGRDVRRRPVAAAAVKSSSRSNFTRTSANRATAAGPTSSSSSSSASSSTTTKVAKMSATARLLQCLTSVPPEVAARVGIVTVGVTAPPSAVRVEQPATRTSVRLSSGNAAGGCHCEAGDEDDEIRSEHGEVLEYWPEGAYYFDDAGRKNGSSGSGRTRSRRSSSVNSSGQQSQPQLRRSNKREPAGMGRSWLR